jgi:hypothetical protein
MKRPAALNFVVGIARLQIALAVLAFVGAVSCLLAPAAQGFWLGFQDAVARGLSSASDAKSFGAEQFGEATAHVTITLIFPIGALSCVTRKRRRALIAFLAVGIVISLGQRTLPLLTIIALISACQRSVADYFSASREPNQSLQPNAGTAPLADEGLPPRG